MGRPVSAERPSRLGPRQSVQSSLDEPAKDPAPMNVTKIVKRVFLNMSGLCFREPMPESVLEDPIIFFWVCGVKEMAAWNFSLNKPETRFLE